MLWKRSAERSRGAKAEGGSQGAESEAQVRMQIEARIRAEEEPQRWLKKLRGKKQRNKLA